jgi:hypothetical protein
MVEMKLLVYIEQDFELVYVSTERTIHPDVCSLKCSCDHSIQATGVDSRLIMSVPDEGRQRLGVAVVRYNIPIYLSGSINNRGGYVYRSSAPVCDISAWWIESNTKTRPT